MWTTLAVSVISSVTKPFLSSSTALSRPVLIFATPFSLVYHIKSLYKIKLVQKLLSLPRLPHSTTSLHPSGSQSNLDHFFKILLYRFKGTYSLPPPYLLDILHITTPLCSLSSSTSSPTPGTPDICKYRLPASVQIATLNPPLRNNIL